MDENRIKADAVGEFIGTMIGALESGFVDRNYCTLAEIHQVGRHYIRDNFGIETPNIVDQWGKDAADRCGLGEFKQTKDSQ